MSHFPCLGCYNIRYEVDDPLPAHLQISNPISEILKMAPIRRTAASLALGLAVSAAAFGAAKAFGAEALASNVPKVVVTTKPVHALVAAVMDGVATPALLVSGASSPHTFTLRPSSARAINEADVFIRVSERLEPFTRKIVTALPEGVTLITLDDEPGVSHLPQRSGGTFEPHHHDHGEEHEDHDDHDEEQGGNDPHIWLDPENAKAIADGVAAQLSKRYPEYADRFASNARQLDARISKQQSQLAAKLAVVKDRPFIIFHDATQYFEHRFGLTAAGSITLSPDIPPSARRLTDLRQKIKGIGAVCVFAEPGYQPSLVAAVTEGTLARTGTIDAEAQLLEPGTDLYFKLMEGLGDSLARCLAAHT